MGEKNREVFVYRTEARTPTQTFKCVWIWMRCPRPRFFFLWLQPSVIARILLSKPSRFHNWDVCRWNSEGQRSNLASKWTRRRPRCPRAAFSVSVTMIYNKALEESACGLQHQHTLNSTVVAGAHSHPLGCWREEKKKNRCTQQNKFRVPSVSTDERYIMR